MYISLTISLRRNRPFVMTLENKELSINGEVLAKGSNYSPFVDVIDCRCTQELFDLIINDVGTLTAPALIKDAQSVPFEGRKNLYIENGSVKILAI